MRTAGGPLETRTMPRNGLRAGAGRPRLDVSHDGRRDGRRARPAGRPLAAGCAGRRSRLARRTRPDEPVRARPTLPELAAGPTPRGEGPRPGHLVPRHGAGASHVAIHAGCSGRARSSMVPTAGPRTGSSGCKFIKGNLGYGPSWMDGQPATILDYSETSLLYANYRDEIRQVGPGLFLGAMYSRTTPEPTFMMYFALQALPTRARTLRYPHPRGLRLTPSPGLRAGVIPDCLDRFPS